MSGKRLNTINAAFKNKSRLFDNFYLKSVRLWPEKDKLMGEFQVKEEHLNQAGYLHSGLIYTLVDAISAYSYLRQNPHERGLSANVDVRYHEPAKLNDHLRLEGRFVEKVNEKLLHVELDLKNTETNKFVAYGNKHKAVYQKPLFADNSSNSNLLN